MSALKHNKSHYTILIILGILCLVVFFFDVYLGPVKIPVKEITSTLFNQDHSNKIWSSIVLDFRVPKSITALLAGAALSASGLMMQTVFRNPLAGPYVLGINAGASLGVALLMLSFGSFFSQTEVHQLNSWMQIVAAFIGALAVLVLILFVAYRVKDIMTILILGILFGSAISAVISILQYFSQQTMLKAFVIWSMGSLGSLSGNQVNILVICTLLGIFMSLLLSKSLNTMQQGESYAKTVGMRITRTRMIIFFATSLMAGSITAFCGPIGFIGIAVPHVARLIVQTSNHKWLMPASILCGAIVLLICDIATNLAPKNTSLPINSITALVGIPIVIWIIFRRKTIALG